MSSERARRLMIVRVRGLGPRVVVYEVSDHDLLNSRSQGLNNSDESSAALAEADAKFAAMLVQDPDDVRPAKPSRSKRPPTAPPTNKPAACAVL